MLYQGSKNWGQWAAYGAGISAFLYAVSFIFLKDPLLYSIFLMLVGKFGLAVFVVLYDVIKDVNLRFARYVLILGVLGSAGALLHGGYDLANAINPPGSSNPDLPSQIDPRGLLTFGVMGAAILKLSILLVEGKKLSQGLGYLGMLSGLLMIVVYLGRLTVLDPTNPILLYPILLEGFIVGPVWYLWLGSVLGKR